jgi:hypothetical protein
MMHHPDNEARTVSWEAYKRGLAYRHALAAAANKSFLEGALEMMFIAGWERSKIDTILVENAIIEAMERKEG